MATSEHFASTTEREHEHALGAQVRRRASRWCGPTPPTGRP